MEERRQRPGVRESLVRDREALRLVHSGRVCWWGDRHRRGWRELGGQGDPRALEVGSAVGDDSESLKSSQDDGDTSEFALECFTNALLQILKFFSFS